MVAGGFPQPATWAVRAPSATSAHSAQTWNGTFPTRIQIVPGFFISPYTSSNSPFPNSPRINKLSPCKRLDHFCRPNTFPFLRVFHEAPREMFALDCWKKAAFPITSMGAEHNVDLGAATWEIWKQEFSFLIKKVEIINEAPEATRIPRNSICLLLYTLPFVSFF